MTWLGRAKDTQAWQFSADLIARFRASYVTMLAAALAYYAAFSLGPLLLLLGGWLGVALRTRPDLAGPYRDALRDLVAQLMPLQENSTQMVERNFDLIVTQLSQGSLLRTVLSLLVLVWAASGFFTSLQLALEVIFDVSETRGFVRRRLVAILLVIGVALVIAVEIVGGVILSSIIRVSQAFATLPQLTEVDAPALVPAWLTNFSTLLLRLGIAAVAFTAAFRYLPRRASTWIGAFVGGVFSTLAIYLTRELLVVIFDVNRFNVIYGVITSVVVTLLWLYLALLMFLFGALLSAEVSAWRRQHGHPGPERAG